MTRRADNDNAPRLIGRKEAAAYLGIAESTFSLWVANLKIPRPIAGTRKWDKKAIDARLDELSGFGANDNDDPYEKWISENAGTS
jgi:predicted DNA-binding transcriptional regulator AlpA